MHRNNIFLFSVMIRSCKIMYCALSSFWQVFVRPFYNHLREAVSSCNNIVMFASNLNHASEQINWRRCQRRAKESNIRYVCLTITQKKDCWVTTITLRWKQNNNFLIGALKWERVFMYHHHTTRGNITNCCSIASSHQISLHRWHLHCWQSCHIQHRIKDALS